MRTIPNLQVDKIMIRKKKNKSSQKVGESHVRKIVFDEHKLQTTKDVNTELNDNTLANKEHKEQKVKWKIV